MKSLDNQECIAELQQELDILEIDDNKKHNVKKNSFISAGALDLETSHVDPLIE